MGSNVYVGRTHRQVLDDGTVNAATLVGSNGADWSLALDTTGRVRHVVEETANNKTETIYPTLWYIHPNGTNVWTRAATSGTAVIVVTGGYATDGDATTERLGYTSGGPTFTGGIYCDDNDNAHGVSLRYNYTEVEFCFRINSAIVSATDTVQLRVYNGDTALNSYDDSPVITATGVTEHNIDDVSDGLTVGESVTLDPLLLEPIDVDDGLTVADTPTVSLQEAETLVPSVSDNLGIGESVEITPLLLEDIDVSDGLTVADAPALDPLALEGISVSDGVTVGESTAASLGAVVGTIIVGESVNVVVTEEEVTEHNVNVSDGLGVGESVTITPLVLEDVAVSDGLAVGESVSLDPIVIDALISDGLGVGESVSVTPLLLEGVDVSDSLGVGESVTVDPLLLVGVGVSGDITLGESVTVDPLSLENISVQDGLTLADTPTIDPLLLVGIDVDDGVTLTDEPELNLPEIGTLTVSVSDTLAIGESVSVEMALEGVSVSDGLTLADTPTVEFGALGDFDINVSDGLTIGESVAATMALEGVTVEDGLTIGESLSALVSLGDVDVSDSITLADTPSIETTFDISVSDGLTVGEAFQVNPPNVTAIIDHEEGDLSDWDYAENDFSATADAALNSTTYGLEYTISGSSKAIYKGIGNTYGNAKISFYLDPNGILNTVSSFLILRNGNNDFASSVVYDTELSKSVGQFRLRHILRSDNYTQNYSDYINIDDAPVYVEVDIFRARGSTTNDGYMLIYHNGSYVGSVSGIDNYDKFGKLTRIAGYPTAVDVGYSIYLDEIVLSVIPTQLSVVVSDGLTVADSPSLDVPAGPAPQIDVSDNIGVGENVSLAVIDPDTTLVLSVQETISVGESVSVTPLLLEGVSVSESLAIGESVTVSIVGTFIVDHEEGDLSDWTTTAGNFSVTTDAAMDGTVYGLEATFPTTPELEAVLDVSTLITNVARVGFMYDPNDYSGAMSSILKLSSNSISLGSERLILVIRSTGEDGGYKFRVGIYHDNYHLDESDAIPMLNGPNRVEVKIARATSAVSSDGYLEFYLEGILIDTLSGVDNYHQFEGNLYNLTVAPNTGSYPVTVYYDEIIVNGTGNRIWTRIGVDDSLSISESLTVSPLIIDVDKSESITIGDSIDILHAYNVSMLDSVSIAESYSIPPLVLPIHELENITVGEIVAEPILHQEYGSRNNVYPILSEDRTIIIEQEDRTYSIAQEQRVVIIEQE